MIFQRFNLNVKKKKKRQKPLTVANSPTKSDFGPR